MFVILLKNSGIIGGQFMKSHKTITIDTALALELQRREKTINVSEICQNALMVACEMEKPKTTQDAKTQLLKLESQKAELIKIIKLQESDEKKLQEKVNKKNFKEDLIKLREIRFKYPNQFSKFRIDFEKEYNISNAELMRQLDKV
jgi:hypothetical protein